MHHKMQHIPRILSIDGGGVRGLSTLLILLDIMEEIGRRSETFPSAKPCDHFNLIGGTGTGGLIAIMLGLLEMVFSWCIPFELMIRLCKSVYTHILTFRKRYSKSIKCYCKKYQSETINVALTTRFWRKRCKYD